MSFDRHTNQRIIDHPFKVMIFGSPGSGKTSLVITKRDGWIDINKDHLSLGSDNNKEHLSLGSDFCDEDIEVAPKKTIQMEIFDIERKPRKHVDSPYYYTSAHGFIITADLTDQHSFSAAKVLLDELTQSFSTAPFYPPFYLVRTKSDCKNRVVTDAEAQTLAASYPSCRYIETSVTDVASVHNLFSEVGRGLVTHFYPEVLLSVEESASKQTLASPSPIPKVKRASSAPQLIRPQQKPSVKQQKPIEDEKLKDTPPQSKQSSMHRLKLYTKETAVILGTLIGGANGAALGLTLAFALSGITGGLSIIALPLVFITAAALGGFIGDFMTRDKHKSDQIKKPPFTSSHLLLNKDGIKPKADLKQENKQPVPLQNHNVIPIAKKIKNDLPPLNLPIRPVINLEDIKNRLSCPISGTLIENPVITPQGQTYDKIPLATWLERKKTDPITRSPLNLDQCIPDRTLNHLLITIKKYQKGHSSSFFNADIPKDALLTKEIEKHLYCPITGKVMTDPVLASDGCTYERKAILERFAKGHFISPITEGKALSANLIENRALRDIIEICCKEKPEFVEQPKQQVRR